ncbi:MAG: hypothetical protein ACFFDW_09910 [Candidatus Thorarchaeota archaeon]
MINISNEIKSERLISDHEPTDKEIIDFIGKAAPAWKEITTFFYDNYDFLPEKKKLW